MCEIASKAFYPESLDATAFPVQALKTVQEHLAISAAGEELVVRPDRTIFWPRAQALLLADMHLGKDASFRSQAVPVPLGASTTTLKKLTMALADTGARRVIVLGDLLHARNARQPAVLAAFDSWRRQQGTCQMLLVRGNHDRRAGDPPPSWDIQCVDEPYELPPFALQHYPEMRTSRFTLAGHLHPAVRLSGPARMSDRATCFWIAPDRIVFPAFGEFTGTLLIRPRQGDRILVPTGDQVVDFGPGRGGAPVASDRPYDSTADAALRVSSRANRGGRGPDGRR